ncbi:MAG: pilus assembly protein TadG-related protein [Pseudomonadota bacterium]|jgi:Flp pilus assembly protein TadG
MRTLRFNTLKRLAGRFDDRGNVAIVVALALAPICVASLGAIDLARGTSAKSQLQDALDAAALAAARSNAMTDAELTEVGERYLTQNLALSEDFALTASSFQFGEGGRVIASARLDVTPFIAGLLTGGTMAVGAETEVVRASNKVEIALVLDVTGSMNQGSKLSDMKSAAKKFIDRMEEVSDKAVEPNSVRISMVPFANTVRVKPQTYRYATWVDQNGSSPINNEIFTTADGTQHANRFDLFAKVGDPWRGCFEMRQAPYDVQDTPPTSGATLYTPYFAVDEPDKRTNGYGQDYQNDYLADGTNSNDWRVRQGSVTKYKRVSGVGNGWGPNRGCGVAAMVRLSTDFQNLRDEIDGLDAEGNTNIPIGMAWGWNTLAPHAPFGDGVAYNTTGYKKIVVLMTDGENTISSRDTPNDGTYAATGYIWQGRVLKADGTPLEQGASSSERTKALDSRLKKICENMKAKKIEIFTIRVEDGDSALLEACATSPEHYYNVASSSTLNDVFQSIAGQIAALHLAK